MKKTAFLILTALLFVSCTSKTEKIKTKKEIDNRKSALSTQQYVLQAVEKNKIILQKYINDMPLEKKVAQLFIENLEGNKNFRSYETYSAITDEKGKNGKKDNTPLIAGGYLFFTYNLCDSVDAQKAFMDSIRAYSIENNQLPPYLAIDQEGGYVNRLRKLTGGLPAQETVADTLSVYESYELYENQAKKMKELGFHMNIAPVIEVCSDDNRDFLNGRSFGDYDKTVNYGKACVYAYENNDIATVIKHFPGNTNTDPHTGLPEIMLNTEDLMESIKSFKEVLEINPEAILMSHARTKAIDADLPACLSKKWISEIIRDEFHYDGLIFSDDIFMGALADNGYPPEKAAIMAIDAGVNCIMTSEKRFGKQAKVIYQYAINNPDFYDKIDKSVEKILKYKIESGIITYEDLN